MPFTGGALVASCQLGMRRDSWSTSSLRASNCATPLICMQGRCAWQATFARGRSMTPTISLWRIFSAVNTGPRTRGLSSGACCLPERPLDRGVHRGGIAIKDYAQNLRQSSSGLQTPACPAGNLCPCFKGGLLLRVLQPPGLVRFPGLCGPLGIRRRSMQDAQGMERPPQGELRDTLSLVDGPPGMD